MPAICAESTTHNAQQQQRHQRQQDKKALQTRCSNINNTGDCCRTWPPDKPTTTTGGLSSITICIAGGSVGATNGLIAGRRPQRPPNCRDCTVGRSFVFGFVICCLCARQQPTKRLRVPVRDTSTIRVSWLHVLLSMSSIIRTNVRQKTPVPTVTDFTRST